MICHWLHLALVIIGIMGVGASLWLEYYNLQTEKITTYPYLLYNVAVTTMAAGAALFIICCFEL